MKFRWRRAAYAAAGSLLVGLLSVLPASPAAAATGQISGLGGKCIDVAGASSTNGTAVQLYDCNGTGAQQWNVGSDGTIRALGKCLDVSNNSTADGALIHLWDCVGGANQQWVVTAAKDIVNPAANKCLDVVGNNSANTTRLQLWTCTGAANQKWTAPATGGGTTPSGFVVTEAQFNQMFPSRNSFYTYSGLTAALSAYPAFANTGSDTVKKQEAAAFLANVNHETGGLYYIVEQNTANYPNYCDWGQSYGCPAGQSAYYGRGPIQLSWNFNYKAAG
ncbi:ricin-type beta-trefoil lectin domain protein, partial [Streptomyces sp. NPDC093544]|uniref:ricin-type beta-trefoil lectin domain protein n=1 Tax=Streptomyces sp. NPDC093544 TaxID=3155200 RepID=UPI003440F29C